MEANPVGWFEIPVLDLDRAETFYQTTLGYTFTRQEQSPDGSAMSWFPMVDAKYGAAGTLIKGGDYTPSKDGALIYFSVEDIPSVLEKAAAAGGEILMEKTDIGEHGFMGICTDTEGNRFAVHAMK